MRQSACLVINPIKFHSSDALFNCTPVDRASDSVRPRPKAIHFSWFGRGSFVCSLVHWGSTDDLLLLQISSGVVWYSMDLQLSHNKLYQLSPRLCFFIVLKRDLFVYHDDSLTS